MLLDCFAEVSLKAAGLFVLAVGETFLVHSLVCESKIQMRLCELRIKLKSLLIALDRLRQATGAAVTNPQRVVQFGAARS
jgi:hypothetical protein